MQVLGPLAKLGYGTGAMAHAAKDAAFINFVMFYYTQVVGVSGTLTGLAAALALTSDAITDPLVGSWTDRHRSARFGRRHPFMAAAAVPLALCFVALFAPPSGVGEWGQFAWLVVWAVLLRTALTVFSIPYTALGAELSQDYEERSVIVSYRTGLGWLAGLALPAFALGVLFPAEGGADGRLRADNYFIYGLFSAGVALFAIAVATISTRQRIPFLPPASPNLGAFHWTAPFRDLRHALSNRNFRWLFIALFVAGGMTGVSISLGFYMNTYFWEFTTNQMAAFGIPMALATAVAFVLIRPLGGRYEKRSIFVGSTAVLILNGAWWVPLRLLGVLPANGTSALFGLAMLNAFVLVLAVILIQIMGPSMVADVVDEHELESGERREGVFFAALGFATKAVTGLGNLVGGMVIDAVGLPTGALPGSVAPDVLFQLGIVAGPLVAASFLLPLACLLPIRLSRAGHAQVRSALEARR